MKPRPKRKAGKRKPTRSPVRSGEWIGGILTTPFYVTQPAPYRPEMMLWLELPERFVVGSEMVDPDGPPASFGAMLQQTMHAPLVGPPRRPARIRVCSKRLAAEVWAAVLDPDIEVVVAPTPELDELLRLMTESLGDGEPDLSYFEKGRISAAAIEALFRGARLLFTVAPWKNIFDSDLLRLDIPALGVEGACLSIIGRGGESFGFIIFPSLAAYERFLNAADEIERRGGPVDPGTPILSLNFERAADLPPSMRREAAKHGWEVASSSAYPLVQHRDRDGLLRPLTEHDVRIVSACATSLGSFFIKHPRLFERESFEPVCESFYDENDLEVRFTAPFEAGPLFAANERRPVTRAAQKVGRNAPCPCGSGRKYKQCCLRSEQSAYQAESTPAAAHDLDRRLVEQMMRYAAGRFGAAWQRAAEAFGDPETTDPLVAHWSVYHADLDGQPVSRWFLEARRRQLSYTERDWLEAQQQAWLSVWEVSAVAPGRSVTLEDLLTGEQREVMEVSGSKILSRRDAILGRVVDCGGVSLLCGSHTRPLPPMEAAGVVRRIRRRLRLRRQIPAERLRDDRITRFIIARWEEAVEALDDLRSRPPEFQNTDGDALLLTVDHFDFDAAHRADIEARLAEESGVRPPEPDDPDRSYVFLRPGNALHRDWETTVVARAEIAGRRLRVETNSVARADAARERIEAACGSLICHRAREHSDPVAQMKRGRAPGAELGGPAGLPAGEADALMREFKARHYADWIDQPLPVLAGRSPRDVVGTRSGREAVDVLLKDMEHHEARMPQAQRFDFSGIRRELGLV